MKGLKRNIIKHLVLGAAGIAVYFSLSMGAFAAGGSPYGPHEPEDTGLIGYESILATVGIILYVAGILTIVYTKVLKGKISEILNRS